MGRRSAALGVLVWLVGSPAAAGTDLAKLIVTDGPDARRERGALVEALELLPTHPWRVAVIDADAARPEVRPTLRRLDAFTTTGGRVVYILRHSVLLQGAIANSRFHVHALASVIWHEMAHIGGASETQARKAEEDLWTRFIRDGQVDTVAALRYLSALKRRPHDELLALGNLEIHPALQVFVDRMWERSPTFRQQVGRLAGEPHLRLQLLGLDLPARSLEHHARSLLAYDGATLVSARLHIRPGPDAIEYIAHELEHVLEQLDGVDLRGHEASSTAWRSGGGTYETRRAIEIGRRVAREVWRNRCVATARSMIDAGRFLHVRQRDRASTWGARPSARVSGNGRYLVFVSAAPLVDEDRNDLPDIYVVDLATGQLSLESVGPAGLAADGWSANPDISADGRFIVFESTAGNLTDVPGVPGEVHVFLRDRHGLVTWLASANAHGEPANGSSRHAAISADGSAVVFESTATDLVPAMDTAPISVGIYLVRRAPDQRVRIDVPVSGGTHTGPSMSPAISADGRFVAFASTADLAGEHDRGGIAGLPDGRRLSSIYVRDTRLDTTTRVSTTVNGSGPDGASYHPAISADGRYVTFASEAMNPIRSRGSRIAQIYVHDRATGTSELVSRRPDGRPADGPSRYPVISGDGRVIAFQSLASNLLCRKRCTDAERDINMVSDIYVVDRGSATMTRASRDGSGLEWMAPSRGPSLDHSGRVLAFSSRHPIDGNDVDHDDDVYIGTVLFADRPATNGGSAAADARTRLEHAAVAARLVTPREEEKCLQRAPSQRLGRMQTSVEHCCRLQRRSDRRGEVQRIARSADADGHHASSIDVEQLPSIPGPARIPSHYREKCALPDLAPDRDRPTWTPARG